MHLLTDTRLDFQSAGRLKLIWVSVDRPGIVEFGEDFVDGLQRIAADR